MVAPLAAAAETTLYGRLDTALVYGDDDTKGASGSGNTDSAWDIDTGTTRIGVKGSEDLGNGLSAIFQAEWEFTSSEHANSSGSLGSGLETRLAYGGLSGGFGTVAIGRQWTPYYGAVNKTDIFNNPGGSRVTASEIGNIANANGNSLGPSRVGNALAYVTPNFNGFVGKLALVIDRGIGQLESDGVDAYNPSLQYDNGPISIGASALEWDGDVAGVNDVWGVAGSYNFGMFKLIAQYEDRDETQVLSGPGPDDGADEWSVAAEANFGNNTIRALYSNVDYDKGNARNEMDVWAVGFQHNFSARTRVYAEYAANNVDNRSGSDVDMDQFSLGLRHDF